MKLRMTACGGGTRDTLIMISFARMQPAAAAAATHTIIITTLSTTMRNEVGLDMCGECGRM